MVRIEYKDFWIRMAKTGLWWIEKDGGYVMPVNDEADAKTKIDKFRGES